ncbi:MAG: rhodanese-like domain-containing protein [Omnitrophica WOR_2 bacterium]
MLKRLFGPAIQQINTEQVHSRLAQKPGPVILDVRQPEEYREGHISGAKLIPLGELTKRMGELPKNREIICVCESGSRSSVATRQLISAGYSAVNLRGGMAGWQRSGMKVSKGSGM